MLSLRLTITREIDPLADAETAMIAHSSLSPVTQISNMGADMAFLDEQRWQGKIFDGTWRTADGGVKDVVEPATGDKLGTVGFAALSDLERSALRAREAQVAWAAAPFRERAAVMRRAAELWAKYSDDIQGWLIRESGGTRAKTARELSDAVDECLEASALPSHALGEVLPSEKAPLSMSRRVPVGVVGVIAPFNAPVKLAIRSVADLDRTVAAAARGSFFNAGQGCMVIGRHLVHESIYDEYVDKLAAMAHGLTVGNPATDDVDLGPIIDERQRDRIHSLVTASIAAGATLRAGGTYDGLFYRPTVLTGAGPGTPAYDNEIFGPVAPVISFATPGEAIDLASDSEYGLDLSIMTADIGSGLQMALRIPTGTAHINDQTVEDDANAPFGGMRHSGNSARFGGAAANIEAYTDTRWITARSTVPG
jgi:acyl-CoA reductase-like NAD-dependent aldehyde dehydrogenase